MLIEELGTYLQGLGHGTLGTDLFLYQLPDTPDTCVAIREYAGAEPEFVHDQATPNMIRPRFQMVVRGPVIPDVMLKASQVWSSLVTINNTTIDGTFYQRLVPLQSPFLIERDENNRWVAGANFEAMKEV
jgi:hypothetical protein